MQDIVENATRAASYAVGEEAHLLSLTYDFPEVGPARLFAFWTRPELLCRWWPREAATDPRVGGEYRLSWPGMGWVLRGRYTEVRPGVSLGFTWRWEHEPDDVTRDVAISFAPLGRRGTRLTLVHGPYADGPNEAALRQSHLDGWTHFLAQLSGVCMTAE